MATLEELEPKRVELDKQIPEATKNARKDDFKTVKEIIKKHKFTASMLIRCTR